MLYELIKNLKPDFIVKGSDWKDNVIGSDIAEVIYFEKQTKLSTTRIEKMANQKYYEDLLKLKEYYENKK